MAKSVYYYWRAASSNHEPDPYELAKDRITQIFNAHQGRYGYRRVHLELRNQQQYLNHFECRWRFSCQSSASSR